MTAITSLLSKISLASSEMFGRSLDIRSGAAKIDHMLICILHCAVERPVPPTRIMSGSFWAPGAATLINASRSSSPGWRQYEMIPLIES